MVQTRSTNGKKRSRVKKEEGCKCCEEKTKCSGLFNQNGKNDIRNSVNYKDSNARVTKKPSGKRGGSPITTLGVLQRRNSNVEGSGRSSEQCVKMVDDWLKNFQTGFQIGSTEEQSMEEPPLSIEPSTSTSQEHEEYTDESQGVASPVGSAGPPSGGPPSVGPHSVGPPSVGSSVSAPSPGSSGGETSYGYNRPSSSSQDEQPDSTAGPSGRPPRSKERREKQRVASAKSRRKKKAEEDELQLKEQQLKKENARLEEVIEGMEAQKERYLSGEFVVDDDDVFDPDDPPPDMSNTGADSTS